MESDHAIRAPLLAGLDALGLDAGLAAPLLEYLGLIERWNRAYNLTAVRDPVEMVTRHLLDSLVIVPHVAAVEAEASGRGAADEPGVGGGRSGEGSGEDRGAWVAAMGSSYRGAEESNALRVVDIGSGAGLPGIPLALALPQARVTLVETVGKKARFLREAVRRLGLGERVRVLEARGEHVAEPGAHDCLVARALGTLAMLLATGGHLLRPGGRLLAMKGQVPEDEIAALPPGWRLVEVVPLRVPGLDAERHLVIVENSVPA